MANVHKIKALGQILDGTQGRKLGGHANKVLLRVSDFR